MTFAQGDRAALLRGDVEALLWRGARRRVGRTSRVLDARPGIDLSHESSIEPCELDEGLTYPGAESGR